MISDTPAPRKGRPKVNPGVVNWVRINRYCELTGETVHAVHARRYAGKWRDGIHCKVVEHSLWINLGAVSEWIDDAPLDAGPVPAVPQAVRRRTRAE